VCCWLLAGFNHMLLASTMRTVDSGPPLSHLQMTCTWPQTISLSSSTTAAERELGPHNSGGRILKIFPTAPDESRPKTSTFAVG
jgi:hypothetical protein